MPHSLTQNRDIRFDILKAIGLICIILAHTNNDFVLDQLRNFDVPLMVLVSGALFARSARKNNYSVGTYVQKRFWRLVAPTWCFLSFFFGFSNIVDWLQKKTDFYDWDYILQSYLLIDGLRYVWIIRVFLIIAVLAPFLVKFRDRFKTESRYLLALAIIYTIFELFVNLTSDFDDPDADSETIEAILEFLYWLGYKVIVGSILFYAMSYGCLFALGMLLPTWTRKFSLRVCLFFLAIFLVQAVYFSSIEGEFFRTQEYKYPPQLYYFSYAIFISIALYQLVDRLHEKGVFSADRV
jgi:fucose 4-O-acetylase-like acetyltransferase